MLTPPLTQPTLPTIGSGLPATDAVKESIDMGVAHSNTQVQDLQDSLSTQSRFPTELVNGLTITDLINQANEAQSNSQYLLDNDPNKNGTGGNNKGFDIHQAIGGLFNNIHSTQSFGSKNTPISLGEGKDFDRYASNKNFQTFGYTPGMGEGQEYKYGNAMTWGDTIGRALAGGSHLAYDTFIEGWKGWSRMFDALTTFDASKLMGSEQERYDMAQHQEDIMNKYAIYDTETSKDSIWNRQFFGTMLQQSGFAVGAGLQFAMEAYLTGGVGVLAEGIGLGSMMVAKGVKATATAGELINDTRKVMNVVTNSERVTNGISGIAKKLVPLYGTVDDMIKMGKAGAGGMQMAMTFGGGIKRGLSEFNMARSESIFEAAGTYKQLKDRLVEDFVATNGRQPSNEELDKIKQSAENASSDNFITNLGVLSVMNRIQFDNMFNSFNKGRRIFSDNATYLGEEAFTVAGKIEGKVATRAYEKSWFFGKLGAVKSIATDFGGKKAAWEATKMLGKGLTKIEGSEGVQELLQTASDVGLEQYYYDLYHGKKGYTGKMGSVMDSIQNPLTDTEGMKTFLMGALTGALISPGSKIISKVNQSATDSYRKKQDPNYKSRKDQVEENIHMVNQLYKDPTQFRKEWIANTKVQNKAAATMEEAAKNHNQYVFYNAKDSAFAKTIASAIKLDMFDSVRDTLKEYGEGLSDEDFKKAFDLDANSQNRKDVKSFMTNVGQQMDEYYTTFNNLKDEYGDRVLPELYKNNSPEKYAEAKLAKFALDDAIEMLATNVHKSKQAVKRASALQTEIASNKNIGGSSIEVLNKMGSEQAIIDNINLIEKEITATEKFVSEGGVLTKEQKEILKSKKEELQHNKIWQEAHADIIDNSDESYSPAAEKRAYQAYADLINLYNKRAKLNTVVNKQDVDDTFIKIIDYIRLNKDNKAYVDAMNLLADPNNIKLITSSIISASKATNEIFKKEHKAEVKKAGDTEDDIHDDDIEELFKELEVNKNTTATDLEKHLQEEYAKVKKLTEAAGGKIPEYELWKKTAGVSIAKRFEEAKKGKTGTTAKGTIKVNGKIITMEGVKGSIDFTGALTGTDFGKMMPEITQLIKNWDKDFVNKNLINYNGQFIFNYDGRVFVLVQVGKFIVPYYFSSSGTSGKAIDWHYVFGVDDVNGWIMKGGVDDKGEVVYSKQFREKYPKAIAELERIKNEIRTKLAMTPQQRDAVSGQLGFKNADLRKKYSKSLDSIYKGFDVVEKRGADGVETNDDYLYIVNATLGLTGLDAQAPPPPGPEAGGGGGTNTQTGDDKTKIVINGKVATLLEMNKIDDKVYVDYIFDVENETAQTEEEYEARRGTLIIDKKTLKATDADGNPVEYSIGKPKEEPTEAEELDRINKITDPEKKKVAQIEYIMKKLASGVGETSANKIKEYVDRILKGESRESIIQGLPKSFVDGIDQLLSLQQTTTEVDPRVAEIEERRKKNLEDTGDMFDYVSKTSREDGTFNAYYITTKEARSFNTYEEAVKWINSKYDEEIAALKPVSDIEAKRADIESAYSYITTRKYEGDRRDEVNKVGEDLAKRFVADLKEKGIVKEGFRTAERTDGSVEKVKVNTDAEGNNLGNDWSTAGKFKDEFRKFVDAELAALENEEPEEEEIEIEPEYEAKDYDKVYMIARAIAQGKNVNTPENLQLITNYPKLLEQFLKLEQQRQEALKADPSKADSTNTKYDTLIKNLVDEYGDRIPEDEDDDVPSYAQGLDRIKKAQMESDTMYANQEYQIGYRQIAPSDSLANTTDIVKVETKSGTVTYTRDKINTNYVFDVATKEFPPGTQIIYRVMTEQEDYDKMEPNRLTGEKYDRAKIFDNNGKVKQAAYDDVPIGIYAEIRGKEMLIGTVHEPLWIGYKINGRYPHIASPDVNDPKATDAHVAVELTKNREIRKAILDAYNLSSKFVITGVVSEKSNGILRMINDAGLLKDRVNSKIGEGGSNNRHGYFAIVRNETLQTEVNVEATDVVQTEAFGKNANQYSGVPALMLPTPTGQFMPTFIGLPKIDNNQAEFILEAWRAFTGKKENQELVDAVYKAVDRVMSDKPDINILNEYLNQYYVNLERKKPLSKIGNGSDVEPGQAIFDIDAFGNIKLEVKDLKTKEWVKTTIRTEKDIPANMLELLQNLRTTVKFNDRRNDSLRGINSTEKITFLSMDNGKLISKNMTYNENLLERATTFVDKGTQSETAEKDWVYFANPVVKIQMSALETEDPEPTDIEETPPTDEDLNDQPEEDLGAALLAALNTMNATEEQVEEKKEECTTDNTGIDLQSEINNLI